MNILWVFGVLKLIVGMGKSTVKENASAIDEIKLDIERLKSAFAENLAALENRLSEELKNVNLNLSLTKLKFPLNPKKNRATFF